MRGQQCAELLEFIAFALEHDRRVVGKHDEGIDHLVGVSTRSVDDLVQEMSMTGISKSQVSRLCGEIGDKVKAFLGRPIEGDWPYLWIDATYVKVRQNGRIVSVAVIVAVGVNSDGRREVLGMDIGPSEAETFWTAFLRKLARRGLRGVKLVVSDAHEGIKATVAKGAQRQLAAVPRPLHAQRAGACRQERAARCFRLHRHRVRPGRCRGRANAVAQGRQSAPPQAAEACRLPGRGRDRRARLHDRPTAASDQAALDKLRSNASTARSSDGPRWSASSPTRMRSFASSARSCSSKTMRAVQRARYMTLETIASLSDDPIVSLQAIAS